MGQNLKWPWLHRWTPPWPRPFKMHQLGKPNTRVGSTPARKQQAVSVICAWMAHSSTVVPSWLSILSLEKSLGSCRTFSYLAAVTLPNDLMSYQLFPTCHGSAQHSYTPWNIWGGHQDNQGKYKDRHLWKVKFFISVEMVLHPEKDAKSSELSMIFILEFYAENLGGQGSYTGLDLFIAFDHRSLAVQSQDLTTFQTPLGLLHLTTLPIWATNSVQILQGDISFIIQEEMPNIAAAFMDDLNVRRPPTRYETNSYGWYTSTAFTDPPP